MTCNDYVFDTRDKWPECKEMWADFYLLIKKFLNRIENIRHQSLCKDCWAVAASSAYSDRRCIEMVKNSMSIEVTDSFFASAFDTAICLDSPNASAYDLLKN